MIRLTLCLALATITQVVHARSASTPEIIQAQTTKPGPTTQPPLAPSQRSSAIPLAWLRRGMPYAQARARLLAEGFQVAPFPLNPTAMENRCSGRSEVCRTYTETASCSGSGLGHCRMIFVRGNVGYSVITADDPVPNMVVWDHEPLNGAAVARYIQEGG